MLPLNIEDFEKKLGYKFHNVELLRTALTHSSYSNELKLKQHVEVPFNERLEFLGDSVLSIVTSEYLFGEYSDFPEGKLTRMRADVVCANALYKYAKKFGFGDYMRLGNGEEKNGGRDNKNILADAFEAVLAAIYLDAGAEGKKAVAEFVLPFIKEELRELIKRGSDGDYKTQLQQLVQQSGVDILDYEVVAESGPDHRKTFEVVAKLNSNIIGRGMGHKKSEAEQNAAKEALKLFGESV